MQALIVALLLATVSGSQQAGRLYVHVTPGLQILIDGIDVGTSNAAEGGKMIRGVVPGTHRVVVRSPDGREAAFNVAITEGQTTDANVSPLGFRKLNRAPDVDDSGLVRVTSIPTDSIVEFHGVTRENHDGSELTFDAVPAGRYPITVTQSGKAVRADVDVPKGSIVTVEVNFKSATIRTTDTKPRPRRLQIAEPNDPLRMLNVSSQWKTAIRTALPNTVSIVGATATGNQVKVRLKVPDDKMVAPLLRSLSSSSGFADVEYGSYPHREESGWVVDFIFTFAP